VGWLSLLPLFYAVDVIRRIAAAYSRASLMTYVKLVYYSLLSIAKLAKKTAKKLANQKKSPNEKVAESWRRGFFV
jgi:hypothetical protein